VAHPMPGKLRRGDDDLALALELADVADGISMERFRAHDLKIDAKPDLFPRHRGGPGDRVLHPRAGRRRAPGPRDHPRGVRESWETATPPGAGVIDPIDGTRKLRPRQ